MSKELALSKTDLTNEGIDVKVTQSDIIDYLVSEKIETFEEQCKKLNQNYKAIKDLCNEEYNKATEIATKDIKAPKSCVISHVSRRYETPKDRYNLYTVNRYESKDTIKYVKGHNSTIEDDVILKLAPQFKIEVEGIIFFTGSLDNKDLKKYEITVPFKHSKRLIDMINAHTKEVDKFLEIVPEEGINEKKISRDIKNKFTKEFLKTMSTDFKKSLKLGFNTSL
jgi:hypothetical protein